jgi:hypothetical protein
MVHVVEASYIADYRVFIRFDDGTAGELDLESELHGQVFEPLRDPARFRDFRLAGWTLAWPNGADFAPAHLHARPRATRPTA